MRYRKTAAPFGGAVFNRVFSNLWANGFSPCRSRVFQAPTGSRLPTRRTNRLPRRFLSFLRASIFPRARPINPNRRRCGNLLSSLPSQARATARTDRSPLRPAERPPVRYAFFPNRAYRRETRTARPPFRTNFPPDRT